MFLAWGSIEFVGAYSVRAVASHQYDRTSLLIAFYVLAFLAAPVFAAANYFILGRALHYIPYLSPIHPGRVVTTFIALDTVVGILMGNGTWRSVYAKGGPESVELGKNLIRSAVIIQMLCFVGFIAIAAIWHRRCKRAGLLTEDLRMVLIIQYVSCGLIVARCIFRTVADFSPIWSPVFIVEWYFWVFEGLPMLFNAYVLAVWHPGRFLPRSKKVWLAQDGTEKIGGGYKDDRPFIVTLFDPFDIHGLITGRDKKTRFWEMEDGTELEENRERK